MTDRERDYLDRSILEIEAELQDIADLRVNYAEHPDEVEDELLEEHEEFEWRLGVDYFKGQGATSR